MSENSKLYENIRDIRTKHEMTQEELAEKLNVNPQSVKGWESLLEKYRSEPKLKHLLAMCDIFDCDLDHLTGRLPESTHDIHFVCDYTGLTEAAVRKIANHSISGSWSKLLSHMIVSDGFEGLMTDYGTFIDSSERLSIANLEEPSFKLNEEGMVVLSRNEAVHHFMRKVSLAMTGICQEDYYNNLDKASKNTHQKWLEHIDSIVKEHRTNEEEE